MTIFNDFHNLQALFQAVTSASIIMGAHGAALTNAVYAHPDAIGVVELRTSHAIEEKVFENIAYDSGSAAMFTAIAIIQSRLHP